MTMRNRPGGLAYIQIPPSYYGTGAEDLNGHYVTTKSLNASGRWVVEPQQSFIAARDCRLNGVPVSRGEPICVFGINDSYLIPVPDTGITEEEVTALYEPGVKERV